MERVRKGRGLPKGPDFLFNALNALTSRIISRRDTPATVGDRYDAAHRAALEALRTVGDDDWLLGTRFIGEYQTMAEIFRYPCRHVAEHAAEIRAGMRSDTTITGAGHTAG